MINAAGHTAYKFKYLESDGVIDNIKVTGSDSFTSGTDVEFTMVIALSLNSDSSDQVLYSSWAAAGTSNNRNILFRFMSSNKLQLLIRTGATSEVWETTNTFTAGSDYLIVLRVSALSDTFEIDVNGVSQSFSTAGTVPNPIQAQTLVVPMILASPNLGGGPTTPLHCDFYYWTIHSRLLTNGEVSGLLLGENNVDDDLEYSIPAAGLFINSYTGGNIYKHNDRASSLSFLTINHQLNALKG